MLSEPEPFGMHLTSRPSQSGTNSQWTIGTDNPDPEVAKLEEDLFELLNETGIGPMGLGGDVTVLEVHVEHADTHMTLNPVAVNYQCWAARRASAHVAADGTVEYDREA